MLIMSGGLIFKNTCSFHALCFIWLPLGGGHPGSALPESQQPLPHITVVPQVIKRVKGERESFGISNSISLFTDLCH